MPWPSAEEVTLELPIRPTLRTDEGTRSIVKTDGMSTRGLSGHRQDRRDMDHPGRVGPGSGYRWALMDERLKVVQSDGRGWSLLSGCSA